jgi:NTP pyrophosphatase (non-canonical NTP hydrolase)
LDSDFYFVCPKCGCSHFGSSTQEDGTMMRNCHGLNCGYKWPESKDYDNFYFRRTSQDIYNNIFSQIGKRAYDGCVKRGFENTLQNDDKALLLIHSEISEAVEYLRHENPPSNHISEFTGVEEELADIIIRVCNYAYAKNFRLGDAIIAKMDFNDTREYQHGGKKF